MNSPPVESPPTKSPPMKSPPVKSPPVKSPPVKSPPVKSPPAKSPVNSPRVKSPPVKSPVESSAGDRTPPVRIDASFSPRRVTSFRNNTTSPAADSKVTVSVARDGDGSGAARTPWRVSPITKEAPARAEKLSLSTNSNDRPIQSTAEPLVENLHKEEESIGVGDKIKKFEKAAEDANASAGRLSRPGSVRGRPRTERLGSDNSREDLPPPATPFKDNVHFDLGVGAYAERPATVLERQQSLTRNAAAASVSVRWQRADSTSSDGEKIRPEPQKIIKPEFKPMPSPVDVTIRSPSLGVKIGDQFPSHGTAFRNVASPDPSRSRNAHKFNDDANTLNNFKACKFKNKEKHSVSKGSSYFTRGSEEIWLVKKKDIEEIEERVLDSFRRAGGNVCMRSESMRPASDGGHGRRHAYARSGSLEAAGARRQACACAPAAHAPAAHAPRPRSRSHTDQPAPAHVLDKYETLV